MQRICALCYKLAVNYLSKNMSISGNLGLTPKKNKLDDELRLINSPNEKDQDLYERLINGSPPKRLFQESQNSCSQIQQEQSFSSQMTPQQQDSRMSPEKTQRVQTSKNLYDQQENMKKISTPLKSNKGCRCERSHCLKKYCDCFKVGQVCSGDCSCVGCQNTQMTQQHEKQIKIVELTRSGKGGKQLKCNCQRSHCLKNYCQCHSAGRTCSSSCNCLQCENKMQSTIKSRKKRQFLQVSDWSAQKPNKQNVLFN